jgi:hypothetical protein
MATTTNTMSNANAVSGEAAHSSATKRTVGKTVIVSGTVKSATPVSERDGKKRSVLTVQTREGLILAQASDGLAQEAWMAYEGDAVELTVERAAGELEIHKIAFPDLGCELTQNEKGQVREAPIK